MEVVCFWVWVESVELRWCCVILVEIFLFDDEGVFVIEVEVLKGMGWDYILMLCNKDGGEL